MNYRTIFLALMVGCFSSPVATAQQGPAVGGEFPFNFQFQSQRIVDSKAMWEDIEIFRRILDRSLHGWAGGAHSAEIGLEGFFTSTTGQQYFTGVQNPYQQYFTGVQNPYYTPRHPQRARHSFVTEGNYLKGYGVVFTATLPWSGPVVEPSKPEPRSLSEWERVRKEIRGEKVEPRPSPPQHGSSLAAVVLKVLAENGRHFSQLGENDRVTVAITLRPASAAPLATFQGNGSVGGLLELSNVMSALPSGTLNPVVLPNGALNQLAVPPNGTTQNLFQIISSNNQSQATKQSQDAAAASQKAEAANLIHLGELRQKEGRNAEAADAYQKAIAACEKLLELKKQPGNSIQDFIAALNMAGDARSKLAQVYYAQGKNDEAIRTLEQIAKAYGALTQKAAPKAKPAPPKEAELGKLIISASKKTLDQVGAGKLSLDEFKKQVTIDYWGLPAKGSAEPPATTSSTPAEKKQ
jgi:hypothetical protein